MSKIISVLKGYPPVIVTNDFGDKIKTYHSNRLLYFYSLKGIDHKKRYLQDIWNWSDADPEYTHDYIQWLLPLKKYSLYNKSAPILSAKTIDAFKKSSDLQDNLLSSFKVMLTFYGFEFSDGIKSSITPSSIFDQKANKWIRNNNHNFLRISRILESLSILGFKAFSHQFLSALLALDKIHTGRFGAKSIEFWKKSIGE